MRRLFTHLFYFPWRLRRIFPGAALAAIEHDIAASEKRHHGELRFAVEANFDLMQLLRGMTSRARAREVFSQLGVWDTEHNNGVLLYLLLAEHRVEIVADRGIDARVDPGCWAQICQRMQDAFRRGDFENGVRQGLREIEAQLVAHFPANGDNPNELSNRPVVL